jgi:hypothetical protein
LNTEAVEYNTSIDSTHANEIEIEKEVENKSPDVSGIQIAKQQKEIINDLAYIIFQQNSKRKEGNYL